MTPAQYTEHRVETDPIGVLVRAAVVQPLAGPDLPGGALQIPDFLDFGLPKTGRQGLGHHGPENLHGIDHPGDHDLAETKPPFPEPRLQPMGRQVPDTALLFQERFCIENGQGSFNERQAGAEFVVPQVGQQGAGFPLPGTDNAVHPAEPLLPGLPEKLLQHLKPGAAAAVEQVVPGVRIPGDRQRPVQARSPYGRPDTVIFGIRQLPGTVLVATDAFDPHPDQ